MKTDQAIKILEGAIKKPNTIDGYLGQEITMAINALKNQPELVNNSSKLDKEIGECNDCIKHGGDWECDRLHCHKGDVPDTNVGELINRQDAIDALAVADAKKGWRSLKFSEMHKCLSALPSVQPEQELLKDGTLVIKTDFDMTKFDRVNVIQNGTHYGDLFYQDDDTRRTGKWIDYSDEGFVECPFCHSATNCDGNKDELHYCFSCGAELRGEQE